MADRFWRTSTGAWTSTSSWAATDGGAPGVPVPTAADDVYFTNTSLPAAGNVTVTIPGTAQQNCRGFYNQRTVGTVTLTKTSTSFNIFNIYGDFVDSAGTLRWSLLNSTHTQMTFNFTAGSPTARSLRLAGFMQSDRGPYMYFDCPGVTYTLTGDFGVANAPQYLHLNQGTISCSNFFLYCGQFYISNNSNAKGLTFGGTGGIRTAGITNGSTAFTVFNNDSTGGLTVTGTPNVQYYRTVAFVGSACIFGGSLSTNPAERAKLPLKWVAASAATAFGLTWVSSNPITGGIDLSGWILGQSPILPSGAFVYVSGNTNLGNGMMQSGQQILFFPADNDVATFAGTNIASFVYIVNLAAGRSSFNGIVRLAGNVTFTGSNFFSMQLGFLDMNGFTLTAQRFTALNSSTIAAGVTGTGTITLRASEVVSTQVFYVEHANVFTFATGVTITAANSGGGNTWVYGGTTLPNATNTNTPNITFTGSLPGNGLANAWRNVNLSGVTSGSSSGFTGSAPRLMGDLTLPTTAGYTWGSTSFTLSVNGGGTQTITGNGNTIGGFLAFNGTGTVNISGNLTVSAAVTHTSGTINFGTGTVALASFTSSGATARTVNLSTATLNMTGNFDVSASGITFTGTSATINMNAAATFAGGSRSYGTVRLGTTGNVVVSGANTFTTLNINANGTLTLPASTTTTVTNFTTTNSAGQATLQSSSAGTQATLSKSSGAVSVSNLRIQDSNATGGASYQALLINNNTNLGNNTGWVFSLYTPSNQFFPFS